MAGRDIKTASKRCTFKRGVSGIRYKIPEITFVLVGVRGRYRLAKLLFHEPTHLEFYGSFSRYLNPFKSLWVFCHSCCSCSGFENTEVAEFEAIILC